MINGAPAHIDFFREVRHAACQKRGRFVTRCAPMMLRAESLLAFIIIAAKEQMMMIFEKIPAWKATAVFDTRLPLPRAESTTCRLISLSHRRLFAFCLLILF